MQKSAIAVLLASILLFGCASVPQSQYDALAADCAQKQQEATTALDLAKAQANTYKRLSGECANARATAETLISSQRLQIESLKADSAVLASARQKTGLIAEYELALAYYNQTYGPGQIPTNAKLRQMETLLLSMNDQQLYSTWLSATRCTTVGECNTLRTRFTSSINSTINALTYQAADIVAKKG